MIRKLSLFLTLALFLTVLPAGIASAQEMSTLNLPPGIAAQAHPLLEAWHQQMHEAGTSHGEMQDMQCDMQSVVDQLPPGILLQVLELAAQLDPEETMTLHHALHHSDLLQQPPGQVLLFVQKLAQ